MFETRVVIIGAGGFAREVQDILRVRANEFEFLLGFIDDFAEPDTRINGHSVLGNFDWFKTEQAKGARAVVGVGAPEVRRRLVKRAEALGVKFCNVIHPSTISSHYVKLGVGVVIPPGCVLTNNITIGNHVHLNLNSTVGHDAVIEDFVTTAPGVHINGFNVIKEGAYIGTGVNIIEQITIGEWSVIGTGAAVIRDIPPNTTAVGCPAKVIKTRKEGWHE